MFLVLCPSEQSSRALPDRGLRMLRARVSVWPALGPVSLLGQAVTRLTLQLAQGQMGRSLENSVWW